jgi:phenylacetate-CoA ligase
MGSLSPRSAFARRAIYPLKDRVIGRDTLGALAWLQQTEALSQEELGDLQWRRLRATLERAERSVPYYRELFADHGIRAADIRDRADLARIPMLTKPIVHERAAELTAPGGGSRGTQTLYTSGTSGEPTAFVCDARHMAHNLAAQLRGRGWHGVAIGDPELRVWHAPRLYATSGLRERAFWTANAAKDRLLNIRVAAAADLSEASLGSWERLVRRRRVSVMYGYAGAIHRFAEFLRDRGVGPGDLPLRTIFLTAEQITPFQKRLIAEVTGARVVDEYGASECGVVAFECAHGGLHVSDENLLVETVDAGRGPEVVVTTLANDLMPLIRYRVGDLAEQGEGPCSCGRGLSVLGSLIGRTADQLTNAGGERVHAFSLMLVLQRFDAIARYQLIQRTGGDVELLVQERRPLSSDELAAIRAALRGALGASTPARVSRVDSIPQDPSGKHRFLRSEAVAP